MDYINNSYPSHFTEACKNMPYYAVFILKPWEAIYTLDNERYESFDQALLIHDHLLETYKKYNYKLIDVPFDTIENRANYILKSLDQ